MINGCSLNSFSGHAILTKKQAENCEQEVSYERKTDLF